MRINYNASAVISNKALNNSDSALSRSLQRLSSGLKINEAQDNPAGLAIAHRMDAQVQGLRVGKSNSNDGISVIETADGAKYVIDGYLDIGLTDTLKDLFVNFIGAAVFSLLGRIYVRQRGKNSIAAAFIPIVSPSAAETESTEGLSQYGTQEYESELEG